MLSIVKIGGGKYDLEGIANESCELIKEGHEVIIVTGGHALFEELLKEAGIESEFYETESGHPFRYTPERMMEQFLEAYRRNNELVAQTLRKNPYMRKEGRDVVSLYGEGGVIKAKRIDSLRVRDSVTKRKKMLHGHCGGKNIVVDYDEVKGYLSRNVTPVISPPAWDGTTNLNVDGDRVTAELAINLGAHSVYFVIDKPGLLGDADDEGTLIPEMSLRQLQIKRDIMGGRGIVKLDGIVNMLNKGVQEVYLVDGRGRNIIATKNREAGTRITGYN